MLNEAERMITAQEAATTLGVHERTVRRWIEAGRLPAEKTGASFAIRMSDVENLAGGAVVRRVRDRIGDHEREAAFLELQGQFNLLRHLYEECQRELAEERRRSARLELELEIRAAA